MTKRKFTVDDVDAIMQSSDSSESDFDDSLDDMDWDPFGSSDESQSDYEDEESYASEDIEAMSSMDDSAAAAFVTNDDSIEDVESSFQNGNDSTAIQSIHNGNWGDFLGRQHSFTFSGQSGLLKPVSPDCSPLDVFSLLVDDTVIRHIVAETNRYAAQTTASRSLTKFARMKKWRDTDEEEMKKFLGLILWMGLVRLSSIEKYWSKKVLFRQSVPRATMSRNRFQLLLSMLHFSNNEATESGNRLAKIQPLIDRLQTNFQALFGPEKDIVIDETLVPWRGRLTFRQYIPNKTHRYGVKLFKLCSLSGYTWGIKVYSGKSSTGEREIGLAKNVCIELTKDLIGKGRTLYVDNFYTSYDLAQYCLENETHLVGTLRANKKHMPKEVLDAKLKRGEMIAKEDKDGVVILKWKDTRDVRILSTKHAPVMAPVERNEHHSTTADTVQRRNRRSLRATEKPLAILDYNKGKGGIDLSDQMASYATTLRKGIKWYRKLATELLLGMSVVNAWIVYKEATKTKMQISTFRERLAEQLLNLGSVIQVASAGASSSHHLVQRTGSDGKRVRRTCASCYAKKKREGGRDNARKMSQKSYTYCDLCPGQPQMCLKCYNEVHQ